MGVFFPNLECGRAAYSVHDNPTLEKELEDDIS